MSPLSEVLQTFSTVVITGGSSGIGKSFIELMGKLNAGLVFCNLSRRDPAINFLGKRLNHFACDLSQAAGVARGARDVEAFLRENVPIGRVLLINNSGFGAYGRFPEPNLSHQLEMMDVNMRALVQLTGLLLPLLRARGGAIITGWKNKTYTFFSSKAPKPLVARLGAKVLARFRLKQVPR